LNPTQLPPSDPSSMALTLLHQNSSSLTCRFGCIDSVLQHPPTHFTRNHQQRTFIDSTAQLNSYATHSPRCHIQSSIISTKTSHLTLFIPATMTQVHLIDWGGYLRSCEQPCGYIRIWDGILDSFASLQQDGMSLSIHNRCAQGDIHYSWDMRCPLAIMRVGRMGEALVARNYSMVQVLHPKTSWRWIEMTGIDANESRRQIRVEEEPPL